MRKQIPYSKDALSPDILNSRALGIRKLVRTMIELNDEALHRMKQGNYVGVENAFAERARILGRLRETKQEDRLAYMVHAKRELELLKSISMGGWFEDEYEQGLDLVGYTLQTNS